MKNFNYFLPLCIVFYVYSASGTPQSTTTTHSIKPQTLNPTIPQFNNSTIQKLNNSTTPSSVCPVWVAFCEGRKRFKDGSIYVGEFKYGKPHGKGKMTWKDGSIYIGEFKNGFRSGWGEFTFPDGDHYEGDWSNETMQGQGAYSWACGHEYIGAFRNDQMDGEGSILFTNGESYSGSWKMVYITRYGLEVPGTLYGIEDQMRLLGEDLLADFKENTQFCTYSYTLEFKAMDQLEEAIAYLKLSEEYTPAQSRFNSLIAEQRAAIKERKSTGGWAKIHSR